MRIPEQIKTNTILNFTDFSSHHFSRITKADNEFLLVYFGIAKL